MSRRRDQALVLAPSERAAVLEALQDAYAECELCEDISQGVIRKLETALEIMDDNARKGPNHYT